MNDKFLRQFANDTSRFGNTARVARDYPVKVLGLRGYDRHLGAPGNDFGIYDDLIVACIDNSTYPFKASTDPGIHMIRHPINPRGCAILSEATHFYRRGKHHNNQYDAFVQAEPVKVYRLNTEGQRVGSSWSNSTINLHSGGGGDNDGDDVRGLSAGCQIIYNPNGYFKAPGPWFEFYQRVSAALDAYGQDVFPYKLMPAFQMI